MTGSTGMTREEGIRIVYGGSPHVVILGAGARIASTKHNPEPRGGSLPSMNDFIEVVGLADLMDRAGNCNHGNFESIYSCLYERDPESVVVHEINHRVREYFGRLKLPETPTIYDFLLLALRPKDLIATFNWDPFLFQAFLRNNHRTRALPRLSFCMET